jgi:hypothetical protein
MKQKLSLEVAFAEASDDYEGLEKARSTWYEAILHLVELILQP